MRNEKEKKEMEKSRQLVERRDESWAKEKLEKGGKRG